MTGTVQVRGLIGGRYGNMLVLTVAVAALALGGVFVRMSETGPVATGALRCFLATPLLFGLHALSRRREQPSEAFTRRQYGAVIVAGAFLAGDLSLWNISFGFTTLAESNLLANLVPFVVAVLNLALFRTVPPVRVLWPTVVTMAGLYLLVLFGAGLSSDHTVGNLMAASTAVFYAAFLMTIQSLGSHHTPTLVMAHVSGWCGAFCLRVALVRSEDILPASANGWAVLVLLAVTSQVMGQTLMAHGMRGTPIQLASVFVLLQPVFAAVYAFVFFEERLSMTQIVGIGLIGVGIAWARTILQKDAAR